MPGIPFHFFTLFLFFVSIIAFGKDTPQTGDQQLYRWFDDYLEKEFRRKPMEATRLGDHRFDHDLEIPSRENIHSWNQSTLDSLKNLKASISPESLSQTALIDFRILVDHLDRLAWLAANTDPFRDDPRVYSEYVSDSIFLPLTQSTQEETTIVPALIQRIKLVPKVLEAARQNIHAPHQDHLKTAINQNKGAIRFYKSGMGDFIKDAALKKKILQESAAIVPALESYQEFLMEVKPNTNKNSWQIGKKKFTEKLVFELQTDIQADDLYQMAQREMDTVTLEMFIIARQLWSKLFPLEPLPPETAPNKSMVIRKVLEKLSDNRGKAENLLADTRSSVTKIKAFIESAKILDLPKPDRCQILEMPEFQRGNSVAYLNNAPPLDARASSVYAISPPPSNWDEQTSLSFMKEYNQFMLQILTIHEAYPGHYVQLEFSNRHPSKIRKVLSSGVFAEGWAVYSEKMMLDQGYGDQDLGLRIHQLKWYLRAIANTILDYQMHCESISDEEGLTLLMDRAFQTRGEALGKIIRSKQSSCQLSTYFAGAIFFKKLRDQAQTSLGDKFTLKNFHHAALNHGTMPLKYLTPLVLKDLGIQK